MITNSGLPHFLAIKTVNANSAVRTLEEVHRLCAYTFTKNSLLSIEESREAIVG